MPSDIHHDRVMKRRAADKAASKTICRMAFFFMIFISSSFEGVKLQKIERNIKGKDTFLLFPSNEQGNIGDAVETGFFPSPIKSPCTLVLFAHKYQHRGTEIQSFYFLCVFVSLCCFYI